MSAYRPPQIVGAPIPYREFGLIIGDVFIRAMWGKPEHAIVNGIRECFPNKLHGKIG